MVCYTLVSTIIWQVIARLCDLAIDPASRSAIPFETTFGEWMQAVFVPTYTEVVAKKIKPLRRSGTNAVSMSDIASAMAQHQQEQAPPVGGAARRGAVGGR